MNYLSLISFLFFAKILFGQVQLVPNKNVKIQFESLTHLDTVYRYDDMVFNNDTTYFTFVFKNRGKVPASFNNLIPLTNDSIAFVSYYPINPVRKGVTDSIVIGFPASLANSQQTIERRFPINSNARKRDTLTIYRHFEWTKNELKCDSLKLADSSVRIVRNLGLDNGILFVNVHANELTSVAAMYRYPDRINFIHLEQSAQRHVHFNLHEEQYAPDPNRIYSDTGRVLTIGERVPYLDSALLLTEELSQKIISYVDEYKVIVAMHNNTDSFYSILSYKEDGGEAKNTELLYINPLMDPDDFIYTTSNELFERFKLRGVSVILQDNDNCVDDGSLSVFCAKSKKDYVNIETQHGHLDEQLEMMKIVLEELSSY